MKKLVFNGCSFMAGDALVWDQYNKENNRETPNWFTPPGQTLTLTETLQRADYYGSYRKKFNLPTLMAKILECEHVDFSSDGKCNASIAIETIAYISTIPQEERKNYHVIIGWTATSRVIKYSPNNGFFINLTAGHYDTHTVDTNKTMFKEYIKARILGGTDEDGLLDYVSNIILLENFLKSNNISYTFFRAVDDGLNNFKSVGPFTHENNYKIEIKNCTDHSKWYKFCNKGEFPISSNAWATVRVAPDNSHRWVTPDNSHPNITEAQEVALLMSTFIKSQNVL